MIAKVVFAATILWMCAIVACSSIKYKDDLGFLVSAQANSTEYPIHVNGKLCIDLDGQTGLCSKRVKSNEPVTFSVDPQPYSYKFQITCSKGTGIEKESRDVESNKSFEFKILPAQFDTLLVFSCVGNVYPADRPQPMAAKFRVQINVYDAEYTGREEMYVTKKQGKNVLVLGTHARTSFVNDGAGWKRYTEKTYVEVKNPATVVAWSESYNMRYNGYGIR